MGIAAFDFFETNEIVNSLLNLEDTDAINENYEALGFESTYFINNMGSMFIIFIMYPVLILLELLLRLMTKVCPTCADPWMYLRQKLYWNALIRLVFEGYSIISICCLIQIKYLSFETRGQTI